jgi:8-oxo-dGTP pyrophosphatase MutT (NUDIX family)
MIEKPKEKRAKREISAGIIVYRRTNEGPKFLILYHGHNYWNFPKGKIESEEKSLWAALRETREETGLMSRDLRLTNNFKAYERFYFRRAGQPIFKIVIFYLAETRNPRIIISKEHEGYGWFRFSEAIRILSKYHDSQRVLRQANDFLHRKSVKSSPAHSPR